MPQGMTAIPPSKLDGLKPSSLGELGQRSSEVLSSRSLALIDGREIFATSVPRALSFRDQAAKIALWKFPAARFHSRN